MRDFEKQVVDLLNSVKNFESDKQRMNDSKMPCDCYYLTDNSLLLYKREWGDSRYPYITDGLTLWAHSSGVMCVQESNFNVFLPRYLGQDPDINFYVGIFDGEKYFPVSLTGAGKFPFEKDIKRYIVYTPECAYYVTETPDLKCVLRAFIDGEKRIVFSLAFINGENPVKTYAATYLRPFLSTAVADGFEDKWFKSCKQINDGYLFACHNFARDKGLQYDDCAFINSEKKNAHKTTSRTEFFGGVSNSLSNATSLINGCFKAVRINTGFSDDPIVGEIEELELKPQEIYSTDFLITLGRNDSETIKNAMAGSVVPSNIDEQLQKLVDENKKVKSNFKIQFEGVDFAGDSVLNRNLNSIINQVDFCAKAKNYAGFYIGIRDIFQQIETATFWNGALTRRRIIDALNYISEDGRPPRQYSYQTDADVPPKMDLRPFIDQGVWIISTTFTYLAVTGDYTILDEICGYYKLTDSSVEFSNRKDSVLEHLIQIAEYLLSKIDDNTGCLRIIYGDWNDAIDGLGRTNKPGQAFGSGVSVMATLQLYRNLREMCDILKTVNKRTDLIEKYQKVAESIKQGLLKYAIVSNDKGERKVLHGWGDDRSYFVGSFCDADGKSRDALITNAFWVICGAYNWDTSIKKDIMASYSRLRTKYGLLTFYPGFERDCKGVGRICNLPIGTAENAASYIHATTFAILSLFRLGESKMAWDLIAKLLPLTHEKISTTQFVMPNSYCLNEELGIDGESMSDWFTGSATVMTKVLIMEAFGIQPDLNGIKICTANYFPMKKASILLNVKGVELNITHITQGGARKVTVNGKDYQTDENGFVYFTLDDLKGISKLDVLITD